MDGPARPSGTHPKPPRALRDAWIIDPLVAAGVLTAADAATLRREGAEWAAQAAVARGAAEDRVREVGARAARAPIANLADVEASTLRFVPEPLARKHLVLPMFVSNRTIRIATANPLDHDAEQALRFATSRDVEFAYALPGDVRRRIDEIFRPEHSIERLMSGLGAQATLESIADQHLIEDASGAIDAPAAKLVDAVIADAVRQRSSDIHFEPGDQGLTIRYRIDGVLHEAMRVPRSAASAVVRRIKVTARLDISDPLRPHDGRAAARVDGRPWELRISTVPIARLGEKVVIRLLDPASTHLRLDAMGLAPDELQAIHALLRHKEGIVLVTGPTGSGKTSTLYAALDVVRTPGINVVTVEDPVEYRLSGVNQIEVNEKQGFTFAGALRSVLRQDPDVVLLGEIRDAETATTAWQAALSGHLVLSTLHTNDSVSAVMRLRDIGIEPYKIAAALRGVVAQRLLRRLCRHCSAPQDVAGVGDDAGPAPSGATPRAPRGCEQCGASGYRGRFAITEILTVDGPIAELIGAGASLEKILTAGRQRGLRTLWEAGLRRVWSGDTGIDELRRVVGGPQTARPLEPASPAVEPAGGVRPADPGRSSGAHTILVADDDPSTRLLSVSALMNEGFRIIEAVDGLDALEKAHQHRPDLVLLDMVMPRLDGFGVLGALRSSLAGRELPVIVLTSNDDTETERRCLELGADDFLLKPAVGPSLVNRIRAVLRRTGRA